MEMGVFIVPSITLEWRNPGGNSSSQTEKKMAKRKSAEPARERLKKVLPSGSSDRTFFELVYEVARMIPRGRVTSYGAIAASLGARKSARMVGWAMNGAHTVRPKVPAHRVVNRVGMLSGKHHFKTETEMEELLLKEGIEVKEDKVVEFKKVFWDPEKEL